jgi:hypothetical protein
MLGLIGRWARPALAFSATALVACPSGDDDAASGTANDAPAFPAPRGPASAPAPGTFELELVSDTRVQLGFQDEAMLSVRLLDADGEPVAGGAVAFALVGRSQDSSLAAVRAVTAEDGVATNTVSSGTVAAAFKVRVSAPGAFEKNVDVAVSDSGFGTLVVSADYQGARMVMQRVVFAQAGTACADAEPMPGDPMVTLGPGEITAQFVALPAEVDYAIIARAEGRDGTVVAVGCSDAVVVARDDRITVEVAFEDEPLVPSGRFALQAELDATAPATALGAALRDGAETLVNSDADGQLSIVRAEARFLLDSLDSTLRSQDYATPQAIALADAIAMERTTPSGAQSPEQSLQAQLSIKDEGALAAVPEIARLTIEDVQQLRLFAELNVESERRALSAAFHAERVEALPMASGRVPAALDLSDYDSVPTEATLRADDDVLELSGVRFALPFGALAAQALREVVGVGDSGHGEELRTLVGCTALSSWLAAETYTQGGACDEGCVQATCDRAVARLVSAAESALTALDEARPALVLSGDLELGDSDGDLIAEHMTTDMLSGEWEPAEAGDSGDAVSGAATASTLAPVTE